MNGPPFRGPLPEPSLQGPATHSSPMAERPAAGGRGACL